MPEFPGVQKVRNQAFRYIIDALDLPGGIDALQDVDLDRATPVVSMQRIMEAGVARRIKYRIQQDANNASVTTTLSFWDGTSWTSITGVGAGATVVPPTSDPVVVTQVGVERIGGFDEVQLILDDPLAAHGSCLVFAANSVVGGRFAFWSGQGSTPFLRPLPWVLDEDSWGQVQFFGDNPTMAAESITWTIEVLTAPPGVLPRR